MRWRLNEVCETKRKTGTMAEFDGWRDKSATEVGNITYGPGISFHSGVDVVVVVCVFFIITCVYLSSFFEEDSFVSRPLKSYHHTIIESHLIIL